MCVFFHILVALLAYDISAALFAHPNLMSSICINVKSPAWAERLFGRLLIIRVRYCEFPTQYQMRCQA
jgi:hypothetical protein